MTTEPAAGLEPVQPETIVPGETIATDMPSLPSSDTPAAAAEPGAEPQGDIEVAASAEPVIEPDKKPEKAPLSWQEKRRIEETNKRRTAEARIAEVEAENKRLREAAAKPADGAAATPVATITPEQAIERAKQQLVAQQEAEAFRDATGRVLGKGLETIPGFEEARQEMVANFGDQLNSRPDFFEAIIDPDLPNGHDVFYALAKDPEQTERLLRMSPVKLGQEVAKLSAKLATPATAAPEPKVISKAPAPVRPVGGAPGPTSRLDDPNIPMDDFAKTFLKQVASRGR